MEQLDLMKDLYKPNFDKTELTFQEAPRNWSQLKCCQHCLLANWIKFQKPNKKWYRKTNCKNECTAVYYTQGMYGYFSIRNFPKK